MRLLRPGLTDVERTLIAASARKYLDAGEGRSQREGRFRWSVQGFGRGLFVSALADTIYPNLSAATPTSESLYERGLLAPTTDVVNDLNQHLIQSMLGTAVDLLSADDPEIERSKKGNYRLPYPTK